jgi:hypothetical protein
VAVPFNLDHRVGQACFAPVNRWATLGNNSSCIHIHDGCCVRTKYAPSFGRSAISINENAILSSGLMGLDVHNERQELLGENRRRRV